MNEQFMAEARERLLAVPDEEWAEAGGDPDERSPVNVRRPPVVACISCASGNYEGLTFVCYRPGGPVWTGGAECDHVCDLWRLAEGWEE